MTEKRSQQTEHNRKRHHRKLQRGGYLPHGVFLVFIAVFPFSGAGPHEKILRGAVARHPGVLEDARCVQSSLIEVKTLY